MTVKEIPSRYQANEVESKWYAWWEASGFFTPDHVGYKSPFTIVIPPPNVTGILHMGHALNNTIQDIFVRWYRMRGVPALWVPGVDHAGIATQNVVERKLAKNKVSRHDLGREQFVAEVWKWKNEYGSTIVRQLRRLGASCDWSRERFTMDESLSHAVRECFMRLYNKGLVYRGDYIINWCPRCQTALSDEEAMHREIDGNFYFIKYPLEGGTADQDFLTIATTRPETMLGDTSIAVNPKDERYSHLVGKTALLPLLNRKLRIIADDYVDPQFGTGLVKVTPAHDPNDFAMGCRHQLEVINILHADGRINENGGPYAGLDRFEARKRIIHDLEKQDLFIKKEPHRHSVGHCYRCDTVVEPYLSKQWFVKMKPLAEPALQAAREGAVKFYPERWTKVYLNWLENIRDWCISRQIWWGHQIPVWYDEEGNPFAGHDEAEAQRKAEQKHGRKVKLVQDPDVLDTWFSSWLWPFSTLGWPEHSKDLDYFYPTSLLCTAAEIIFFWVARMIMAGYEFMGQKPFDTVLIHGTVRVEGGQKMSKSLGNVIDPIEIIDEMGADALRFSLMMLAATDVYLSRQKIEQGRNFTNKIWNAFRFIMSNLSDFDPKDMRPLSELDVQALSAIDKWILTEFADSVSEIDRLIASYRLNEAATAVYHFFWHSFCDWYLELAKPVLSGSNSLRKKAVQNVLVVLLEQSLRSLHPFMPFISEEIWQRLKESFGDKLCPEQSIMLSVWPEQKSLPSFDKEAEMVRVFQEAITGIRDLRSRLGLKPSEPLNKVIIAAKEERAKQALEYFRSEVLFLARIEEMVLDSSVEKRPGMVSKIFAHMEIFVTGLSQEELLKEASRIEDKISELEKHIKSLEQRLSNQQFVSKAPEEVVEKERDRLDNFKKELGAYRENLELFKQ